MCFIVHIRSASTTLATQMQKLVVSLTLGVLSGTSTPTRQRHHLLVYMLHMVKQVAVVYVVVVVAAVVVVAVVACR